MSSSGTSILQKDELNESWCDVHYDNGSSGHGSPKIMTDLGGNVEVSALYTPLNIEKLLNDAQKESGQNSLETSARTSPKGLQSPTGLPPQEVVDWMWDWSSGPEKNPSREQVFRLQHASRNRPKYTLRNTEIMRGSLFTWENLGPLLISHVTCIALGALIAVCLMRRQPQDPKLC
ncbi:bnip3 [Mactra antiquata]